MHICAARSDHSLAERCDHEVQTLCSMSPVMKCTLRDRRSSLETISGQWADFASFSALARPGRSSSASAPAPVCTSWCQDLIENPSRAPKGFDLVTLRRESQAAAALLASADSQVPDCF